MSTVCTTIGPLASLLIDVGAEVSAQLAARLRALDVSLADVDILWLVSSAAGASQREAAVALGVFPTHLGVRVAALCARGLMERRVFRDGRRRYGLYLTSRGSRCLDEVSRVRGEHQSELLGALDTSEQQLLEALLERLARRRTPAAERTARLRRS